VDEASLDIELMMGLLGPGQNLSLYQIAQTNTSLDPSKFSSRSIWSDPTSSAADRLLAALDESYCSVAPAESEGSQKRHTMMRPSLTEISTAGITDCGNKPRTNVISISYHLNPDLNDPAISPVVQRQCAEFGKVRHLCGLIYCELTIYTPTSPSWR
jgi:tripeptidyl-peptidase-1